MIYGIGIDTVEVDRFREWQTKPIEKLRRIFSAEELDYCLYTPEKSAERFAARFAAREALFKAYQSAAFLLTHKAPSITLFGLCPYVTITKADNGIPLCSVDWRALQEKYPNAPILHHAQIHISLSHTRETAHALITMSSTH